MSDEQHVDFEVEIHGAVNSGKTMLTIALLETCKERVHVSPELERKWVDLTKNNLPKRTLSIVAAPEERKGDVAEAMELFIAQIGGYRVRFTSHAGEELNYGGINTDKFAASFEGTPPRIPIFVFNPFQADKDIAWRGFLSCIATLQRNSNLKLTDACRQAAKLLWSTDADALDTLNTKLTTTIGSTKENLVLVYNPGVPDEAGAFTIEYHLGDDRPPLKQGTNAAQEKRLLDCLKDTAQTQAHMVMLQRDMLKQVLGRVDDAIVVLTHDDLSRWTSAVTPRHLEALFEDLFTRNPDRLRAQEVISGNLKASTWAHEQGTEPQMELDTVSAQKLWSILERTLERRAARTQHDVTPRFARQLLEGGYQAVRAVPCVLGALALGLFASHDKKEPGMFSTALLVGALGALLALVFYRSRGAVLALLLLVVFWTPIAFTSVFAADGTWKLQPETIGDRLLLGEFPRVLLCIAMLGAMYAMIRALWLRPRWSLSGKGAVAPVTLRWGFDQSLRTRVDKLQIYRSWLGQAFGCGWTRSVNGSREWIFVPDLARFAGDAGGSLQFVERRKSTLWFAGGIAIVTACFVLAWWSATPPTKSKANEQASPAETPQPK